LNQSKNPKKKFIKPKIIWNKHTKEVRKALVRIAKSFWKRSALKKYNNLKFLM
jgi:hypothetical protein